MAKKPGMTEGPNSNSSGMLAGPLDVSIDLTGIIDAIADLKACVEAGDASVCEKLEGLIAQLTAIATAIADVQTAIETGDASICEKLEKLLEIVATIATSIDAQTDILNSHTDLLTEIKECLNELAGSLTAILEAINDLSTNIGAILDVLNSIDSDIKEILNCLKTIKDFLDGLDVEQCCTGGATATTARCANISKTWTTGALGDFDRCTASFGGYDLPDDNYTYDDFAAIITNVGGTIEPNPNNPDQYTICVPEGFKTCFSRACFRNNVGQLTRVCVVATPNTTEEVCTNYLRVWDKYSEPTANLIATGNDIAEQQLEKLCTIADGDDLATAKLCLLEEHLNPAAPCPATVPPEGLNKELQTLTLEGNVVANYGLEQNVNLQNANGESCGTATVSDTVESVYNSETNQTVITLQECELDEGKTPVQIVKATAVKALTVAAIKTVKSFAIKKVVVKKQVVEQVKR